MKDRIPLSKLQREIMHEFYEIKPTKVLFNKRKRTEIWVLATERQQIPAHLELETICPALKSEIDQSYNTGRNIQSAIFSECVYAQTLANMFNLVVFKDCRASTTHLPQAVINLLTSYSLYPRYSYGSIDNSRILIQAGGHNGTDGALISVMDLNVFTIEFKEPGAKTSEPDLPKYGEDGLLKSSDEFEANYPQFTDMLSQHIGLNIFEHMGSNINNFSVSSIINSITDNYSSTNKYANVCCTEDCNGILVMLPVNQIHQWAIIEGEIRPTGRNHYSVWTPNALRKFIIDLGGHVDDNIVTLPIESIKVRRKRGGNGAVSGYKITPLFFVYAHDVEIIGNELQCKFSSIRQTNPTIASKVYFKDLKHHEVKDYYYSEMNL